MNFFRLYQDLSLLMTLLFCSGSILLAFIIYYSVRNYDKPLESSVRIDEHGEPGIPLLLKLLYLGIAIYMVVAVIWMAASGKTIG